MLFYEPHSNQVITCTCISEQAAPIWSQGQCVSQGSGDLVQPIGMGSLEPEIQGPPITGLLSNYFVCHSSVALAITSETNQASFFLGETNSSPQDENPLNGGPNTGTHSTTSYLCPNNASQMFPTLSDTWHQELLDSANMNIVDGQPSMEIQPEGTVHQDQVGADCNGNSPTEEFDSLTTATDLNIKSRNSSQECDLDHSVVQRIIPPSGSVEGGYPFVIALSEPLPGQVNFGEAKFHGVATVNLEKLNNHTFSGTVPRCHLAEPGIVEVTVMTQTGQHLGTTSFEYVDELTKIAKQITVDHGKQAKFFSKLSEEHKVLSGSSLQSKQQHSLQFLQFLIYTASQTGAKKFIEIIFSTSAGQIVFDSYKDRTCLPEDVARASGHDELANYLQDLTTRFSKEPEFSRKEAHVIDWSELEAAAIAAQTQGCLTEEKSSDDSSENNSDTDYFADVETSSIDSSELSRSTSEDDTSEPNSRDKTKASAYQSISSIGKWAFAGNGTMGKIGQIKEGMKQKSCVLILRDSHFDSSLPEVVKGLDYTLAFHLAIGSKNIPCHLHTVNERFLVLRESITRQPTMSFCKLHPYPDVLKESSLVKNNKGFISKTVASKQRHWNQLNEGLLTTVRARVETKISSLAACVNGSITLSGNDPSRFPIKDQWRQFRYPNDDWINIRDCDGYGCVTLTLLDGTRVSVGTRKSLRVECTAQNSTKDRVQFLLEAQDNSVFRLEKVPLKNVWEEIDKTVTSSAVWTEIQAPGNVFGNVPPGLFLPNGGQGPPGLQRTPGAWTNAIRVAEGESRIRGRPGKQWLQEDYGNTGPKGDADYEGEKDLSMLEWERGSEYSENTKLLRILGLIGSKETHVPVEVCFFATASVMLVSFIASFLQRLFHQYICLGHFEKTKLSD